MQEMQIRCDQVQAELDQANSGTKYLLERADGLRSQRSAVFARSNPTSANELTSVIGHQLNSGLRLSTSSSNGSLYQMPNLELLRLGKFPSDQLCSRV